jgi:hypothetical protein
MVVAPDRAAALVVVTGLVTTAIVAAVVVAAVVALLVPAMVPVAIVALLVAAIIPVAVVALGFRAHAGAKRGYHEPGCGDDLGDVHPSSFCARGMGIGHDYASVTASFLNGSVGLCAGGVGVPLISVREVDGLRAEEWAAAKAIASSQRAVRGTRHCRMVKEAFDVSGAAHRITGEADRGNA